MGLIWLTTETWQDGFSLWPEKARSIFGLVDPHVGASVRAGIGKMMDHRLWGVGWDLNVLDWTDSAYVINNRLRRIPSCSSERCGGFDLQRRTSLTLSWCWSNLWIQRSGWIHRRSQQEDCHLSWYGQRLWKPLRTWSWRLWQWIREPWDIWPGSRRLWQQVFGKFKNFTVWGVTAMWTRIGRRLWKRGFKKPNNSHNGHQDLEESWVQQCWGGVEKEQQFGALQPKKGGRFKPGEIIFGVAICHIEMTAPLVWFRLEKTVIIANWPAQPHTPYPWTLQVPS